MFNQSRVAQRERKRFVRPSAHFTGQPYTPRGAQSKFQSAEWASTAGAVHHGIVGHSAAFAQRTGRRIARRGERTPVPEGTPLGYRRDTTVGRTTLDVTAALKRTGHKQVTFKCCCSRGLLALLLVASNSHHLLALE